MKARLIVLLFSTIMLSSCNMQRYCAQHFPTAVKDSIVYQERVEYRDTLIPFFLPGEVKIDTVYYDTTTNTASSMMNTGLCFSSALWHDGKLIHSLIQKDSIIDVLIKNAIKKAVVYNHSTRTITLPAVTTNIVTGWQNFQIYGFWILVVLVAAAALWRYLLKGFPAWLLRWIKKFKPDKVNR